MRTFLAKNGLMNNSFVALGVLEPLQTTSFLDWRGIVATFVWKQVPFVTLMLAGAMASLDRATIEAGRNLGASRPRVLIEIVLPQVAQTLLVGLVLSFVTMLSVLSVPLMVAGSQPTMLTVDTRFEGMPQREGWGFGKRSPEGPRSGRARLRRVRTASKPGAMVLRRTVVCALQAAC
jgi:ABC-type spermidine/putrescine transport system permease subunit I